jgi:hypothetical protein
MTAKQKTEGSVLVETAKAIGRTAGKVAVLVGAGHPTPKSKRIGKLLKKDKHRLPRRQKKAHLKAAAALPA